MEKEPRKASEVLLELEQKLDTALSIIRTQDLNIKILSNKLNSILEALEKQAVAAPKFSVEAVNTARPLPPVSPFQQLPELDPEKQIPISSEFKLPMESEPKGFRRTSRPETFAGDDAYLPQAPKFPVQIPQSPPGRNPNAPPPGRTAEVVVPSPKKAESAPKQSRQPVNVVQNAIPVMQRVVNGFGKSLYLADVEIIDLSNMTQVAKTRTSANGKWMASLGIGNYRVIIRRHDAITKEKLEVSQDIQVDGTQSPLELQAIIVKAN